MRHLLTRLAVGLTTFSVGVCAATLFLSGPRPVAFKEPAPVWRWEPAAPDSKATAEICAWLWDRKDVSDEDKAVLAAQGFISRMGYTDGTASFANVTAACFEGTDDSEEGYRSRYDTLERRAYGISRLRRGGEKGWTVVFRYTERMGGARMKTGRAVTMGEDFRNLRVEHCDFFLNKVEKKL